MKETIYTIPLNDAFHAEDECPFCRLERDAEQHALEFILGKQSSYMEDDIAWRLTGSASVVTIIK